jgi:hypothetical protein
VGDGGVGSNPTGNSTLDRKDVRRGWNKEVLMKIYQMTLIVNVVTDFLMTLASLLGIQVSAFLYAYD